MPPYNNYGRNAHWLQSPRPEDRLGRYETGADTILQFAPVEVDPDEDVTPENRRVLRLCTDAVRPLSGQHGIILYEQPFADTPGYDPALTRPSDLDTIPARRPVQLCHGSYVRIRLTNTVDESFLGQQDYPGRTMVDGLGATPTVFVGDTLTPGGGNDDDGYWVVTTDPDEAWLLITNVDADAGELDAQMLF